MFGKRVLSRAPNIGDDNQGHLDRVFDQDWKSWSSFDLPVKNGTSLQTGVWFDSTLKKKVEREQPLRDHSKITSC